MKTAAFLLLVFAAAYVAAQNCQLSDEQKTAMREARTTCRGSSNKAQCMKDAAAAAGVGPECQSRRRSSARGAAAASGGASASGRGAKGGGSGGLRVRQGGAPEADECRSLTSDQRKQRRSARRACHAVSREERGACFDDAKADLVAAGIPESCIPKPRKAGKGKGKGRKRGQRPAAASTDE